MAFEKELLDETRSFEFEFENGELKAKEKKNIPSIVGTRF